MAIVYGHAGISDYELFANREVKNSDVIPWKHDSLYNLHSLDSASLKSFESFGTTAFLVLRDKKIVYELYDDNGSDTTRSNSFSVAKSIVSLLTGCALAEGKIKNLNDPIQDYLPDFKHSNGFKLTIRDLLTMSSGIEWDEGYSSLTSITTKAYYGRHLAQLATELEVKQKPGKIFNYQSCNTQLLAQVLQNATGKTISDYASEKIWKPLGAEKAAFWSLDDKNGTEKAFCCFNSTARDFARIGQMVLDTGVFNGKQIVPRNYILEATRPTGYLKNNEGENVDYYGFQFWLTTFEGQKIIYARGILGQYILIIPSKNAVVVRLGHERSTRSTSHTPDDVFLYLSAAFKLLGQ
jgi:CubicO group peptidase (beta-lactamase class C family)